MKTTGTHRRSLRRERLLRAAADDRRSASGQLARSLAELGTALAAFRRDLALTTDFRTVLAEIVGRHLGIRDPATLFPGFRASPSEFRGLLS